jgi:hypothetical protein
MTAITTKPKLFLRDGLRMAAVTPEQASLTMRFRREQAMECGLGSRSTPDLLLYDIDGKRIGRVSWNGRVWLNDGTEIQCES